MTRRGAGDALHRKWQRVLPGSSSCPHPPRRRPPRRTLAVPPPIDVSTVSAVRCPALPFTLPLPIRPPALATVGVEDGSR